MATQAQTKGAADEFYAMSAPNSGLLYKPAAAEPAYGPLPPLAAAGAPGTTMDASSYRPPLQPSGLTYPPPAQPNSVPSFPPPPNVNGQPMAAPPLVVTDPMTPLPLATNKPGLQDARTSTALALREYMNLLRARLRKDEVGIGERLRIQASTVLGDLQTLRQEVADLVTEAESHRWRRFMIGGAIASFIPIVRAIFRRPRHEKGSSNDTEYAFKKSKSLVARILDSARRPGIATVAFFVFAVMYVFQNEVSLRVGRTVAKRLKRLSTKIENGEEELNEDDLGLLEGWRWRVLMWS